MLNHAPIFINSFSRGGSNIFWNIFLTHPDVCSPILETLEIFKIGRHGRWSGYRAAWLTRQVRFFDQRNLSPRRPISIAAQTFIDRILYEWKLKTYTDADMRYKSELETYSLEEVRDARLAAKNNNGLVFLSDVLRDMYPDATFFALVRDPLPLYESYKRRRFVSSAKDFVSFFRRIVQKMLDDADAFSNYHVVRFEDILSDPVGMARKLYGLANLDPSKVRKIRLKAKEHYRPNGTRHTPYTAGQHYWLSFEEVRSFLEADINQYHIQQLSEEERVYVSEQLHPLMDALGYG